MEAIRGRGRPKGGKLTEQERTDRDELKKMKAREYAKKWRAEHLEQCKESCRTWKKENWDKVKAYQREYLKLYNRRKKEKEEDTE